MKKTTISDLAADFMNHLEQKIKKSKDETIRNNLGATLDDEGFSEEAKAKAIKLFFTAVENKTCTLRTGTPRTSWHLWTNH